MTVKHLYIYLWTTCYIFSNKGICITYALWMLYSLMFSLTSVSPRVVPFFDDVCEEVHTIVFSLWQNIHALVLSVRGACVWVPSRVQSCSKRCTLSCSVSFFYSFFIIITAGHAWPRKNRADEKQKKSCRLCTHTRVQSLTKHACSRPQWVCVVRACGCPHVFSLAVKSALSRVQSIFFSFFFYYCRPHASTPRKKLTRKKKTSSRLRTRMEVQNTQMCTYACATSQVAYTYSEIRRHKRSYSPYCPLVLMALYSLHAHTSTLALNAHSHTSKQYMST